MLLAVISGWIKIRTSNNLPLMICCENVVDFSKIKCHKLEENDFFFYCSFYSFYLFCILPKLYFFSSSTISPKIFEHTHHTSTTTRGIYGSIQVGCSTRTWPDLIRWRKTQPTIDWKGVANWASYMWWVDQSTP